MLSRKEKEMFVKDGYSLTRRNNFRNASKTFRKTVHSLDAYIKFLMEIQKIFSPFVYTGKKTITAHNKL